MIQEIGPSGMLALVFTLCALFVYLILHVRWLRRLKGRHEKTWEELDRPKLIGDSAGTIFKTWKYLLRREYLRTNDAEFVLSSRLLVMSAAAYVVLFLVLIAVMAMSFKS